MNKQHIENNRLKGSIIALGIDEEFALASRIAHEQNDNTELHAIRDFYGSRISSMAERLNSAKYKRRKRAKEHIENYLSLGICQFLTLTFTDKVFETTTAKTRRRYVARYLKRFCVCYVANIDYGNDGAKKSYIDDYGEYRFSTAREHYHALVFAPHIDYKQWHKYGAIKAEKVRKSQKDLTKVSRYVAKLTNHAFKIDPTAGHRLLMSRDKKMISDFFKNEYFEDN